MMELEGVPEEWNVIPAGKNKKYPDFKWDAYKERRYPRDKLRGHEGNLAVVCGRTSNNLFAVDLDYKGKMNGVYREQAFQTIYGKLCEELPELAQTRVHKTPHGHHLLYYLKGEIPKTEHIKNVFKGNVFIGYLFTRFHEFLDGVDFQGDKALAIIPPSQVGGLKYDLYFKSEIKEVTVKEFEKLRQFFLLDEPKSVRKGFRDLLNGKLDIHELKQETGEDEHVYWKMMYSECYWNLEVLPEQLFPILSKNQPAFNLEKTQEQLKHVNLSSLKPMTRETYEKYFPMYVKKNPFEEAFNVDAPPVITKNLTVKQLTDMAVITKNLTVKQLTDMAAGMILDELDILTLRDSKQIMIRNDTHYEFNENLMFSRLKEICDLFKKGSYGSYRSNVEQLVKDSTMEDRSIFCTRGDLLNFKNGVYDVLNERLISHEEFNEPFFYVIPWDCPLEEGDCPKFKEALNDWLMESFRKEITWKSKRRAIVLKRWTPIIYDDIFEMIGLCLSLNTSFKKAFLNYGPTHSGKTQFLNLVVHIIGENNFCSVKLHRLSKNEFGTKRLQMKLINACGEIPNRKIKQTDLFKELTGDDYMVPSEIKGGEQFEFKNYAKFWFNANDIPPLDYVKDDAFFGRFILLEFPNQFTQVDDAFKLQFWKGLTEASEIKGILWNALKGLKRLIERKGFRKAITHNTKHVWLMQSDPVYEFLNTFCIKKRGQKVLCDEFYEFFNEVGSEYLSTRAFTIELAKHGIHKRQLRANYEDMQKTGQKRPYYYINVVLKSENMLDLLKEEENKKQLSIRDADLDDLFGGAL